MKNLRLIILVGLIAVSAPVLAQQTFQLSPEQQWTVAGTSSIHDWEMVSEEATGTANIELDGQKIKDIASLRLQLPAKSLDSGKSSMDKDAYEALNADDHPQIKFELTEVESITAQQVKAKGKLTISGTTKTVSMTVNYKVAGNAVTFSGTHPISFTQFNLEPPTAVFGTIKTGDALDIKFETTFKTK